jgi:hypothetical protein
VLIVDDILLSPLHGLWWIVREVHQAAKQEVAGQSEALTAELRELYMLLETGGISEPEYEAREKELLDRLQLLRQRKG